MVLFDGVCNLCSASVQFIIARDPAGRFRFATLQSETAKRLLRDAGLSEPHPDSLVLIEGDRIDTHSTAALRIARGLRAPWPLAYALVVVPRPIRDRIYDFVARRRYGWFGKRAACMVPTPELRSRFLD